MNREERTRVIAGHIVKFLKKNSPIILSVLAGTGVIAVGVTVAKATPKAVKAVEKAENEKGEKLTKFEYVKAVAPSYILPAIVTVATEACITSSAVISKKHEISLTAAYGLIDNSFRAYRAKVIEKHGIEEDADIRHEVVRECANFHTIGVDIPDQKTIWVDEYSGNTVIAYEREIMDAEYHANRNFTLKGYLTLNELYYFLGMPPTKEGEVLAWSAEEGYSWIDFEHTRVDNPDDNGTPIYSISTVFDPGVYGEDTEYPREDDEELPWDIVSEAGTVSTSVAAEKGGSK